MRTLHPPSALVPALAALVAAACGASTGAGVHGASYDGSPQGGGADAAGDDAGGAGAGDAGAPGSDGAPEGGTTTADDWRRRPIYLLMPDRFANGDASNDALGQPGCNDPTSPNLFHGGDVAGIRQRLAYLRDLGVGAVWATPLYAQTPLRSGACGYHGYWADEVDPDDGAMEPKLGTLADVAGLTGDLHAAGMRFVLDMVVNHPGRNARIVSQHPDWFHDPKTCAQLGDTNVYCPLNGLPDYAQENPVVATYLTDLSRGWVQRVMPDGIRMDTAKNVPASYFAQSFVPAVRAVRSDLFLVAEYFDASGAAPYGAVLDAGFDSAFHFALQAAFDASVARGGPLDAVADAVAGGVKTLGLDRALRLTTMIDNHDLPRLMSDAPATMSAAEVAKRQALALSLLFTLPGIPQIYMGDEIGALGAAPDNRRDMPAWAWDASMRGGTHAGYAGDAQATWTLVQTLASLRAGEPALWSGAYKELWRPNGGPNLFAFTRVDASSTSRVLVVASGDAASRTFTMPLGGAPLWPDGTTLKDALGAGAPATLAVSKGAVSVTLPPFAVGIYRAGT